MIKYKPLNYSQTDSKSPLTNYFYDRTRSEIDSTRMNGDNDDSFQPFISERYLIKPDGNTYFQKELQTSEHPFIQEICRLCKLTGDEVFPVVWGKQETNSHNCLDDFEKDGKIQLFITLYFWRYLCYCANIDFRTGEDKTDLFMGK